MKTTTNSVSLLALIVLFNAFNTQSQNLISNGDFELGNALFSSDYTYSPVVNPTEGQYTVTSDPRSWNDWFAMTPDHTPGSGTLMLVVNGATSGSPSVWRQSISVIPFTTYYFQAWVSTAVIGGPAVLRLEINGSVVGDSYSAPSVEGTWNSFDRAWTSSAGGVTTIAIYDSNLAFFPNDFYIDDISFSTVSVPEPSMCALLAVGTGCLILSRRSQQLRSKV